MQADVKISQDKNFFRHVHVMTVIGNGNGSHIYKKWLVMEKIIGIKFNIWIHNKFPICFVKFTAVFVILIGVSFNISI